MRMTDAFYYLVMREKYLAGSMNFIAHRLGFEILFLGIKKEFSQEFFG